jgi:hypothetical protein
MYLNSELGMRNAERKKRQKTDDPSSPDGFAAASRGQKTDDRKQMPEVFEFGPPWRDDFN